MSNPGTTYTEDTNDPLAAVISKCLDRDPWVLMALGHDDEDHIKMSFRAGNGPSGLVESLALFEAAVAMLRIQLRNSGVDPDVELKKIDDEIAAESAAEKEA